VSATETRAGVVAVAPGERGGAWLLAAGAAGLMLLRVVLGSPAFLFGAVGVVAAAPAVARERARLSVPTTLLVGAAGVLLARASAGPPLPRAVGVGAVVAVVLGAVAEELLFRRLLFDLLRSRGTAVAVAGSAIAFATVHLPLYGVAALPVDLGAGLLFGWQRWASGGWAAPAATHALANLLVVLA
jgi:membrane protease YdiL (CAAX protease family)